MPIDIFKGWLFFLTRGKSAYKRMKTLWKRSSDKTLFPRLNDEQLLNVHKTSSKEETLCPLPVKNILLMSCLYGHSRFSDHWY